MLHSQRHVSIRLQSVLTLALQIWALAYGPHGKAKYSAFDLISSEVAPKLPSAAEGEEPEVDPWCRFFDLSSIVIVGARGGVPVASGTLTSSSTWLHRLHYEQQGMSWISQI